MGSHTNLLTEWPIGPNIVIYNLFSISLCFCTVPVQRKHTVVTPRWKDGARTSIENYRGIHHTYHLSRVLERIVKIQVIEHFLSNGLLSERQYGFIAKRSSPACQAEFLSLLANACNENKAAIIIYLDIRKAFDQVPHKALLSELRRANITVPLLNRFHSYLTGRTQTTLIAGHLAPYTPITSGVVQGSVLGPVLFLLYINSILKCIKNGTAFLFADDIKIIYTLPSDSLTPYIPLIQKDLDNLSVWSTRSGLSFSTNKCIILPFRCIDTWAKETGVENSNSTPFGFAA